MVHFIPIVKQKNAQYTHVNGLWSETINLLLHESWSKFWTKKDSFPDLMFTLNLICTETINSYLLLGHLKKIFHVPIWPLNNVDHHSLFRKQLVLDAALV